MFGIHDEKHGKGYVNQEEGVVGTVIVFMFNRTTTKLAKDWCWSGEAVV
jgi:hypothetical protein